MARMNYGIADPNAVMRGAHQVNDLLQGWAKVRAGKALARGDRQSAMDELNSAGDLPGARALEVQGQANEDRSTSNSDDQIKANLQFTDRVITGLSAVKAEGGDVVAAFDQITPALQNKRMPPERIAELRVQLAQDPDRFLTAMKNKTAEQMKRYSAQVIGQDLVVTDSQTGDTRVAHSVNKPMAVSDGTDLISVPSSSGTATTPVAGKPPATSEQMASLVKELYPDAVITSGSRTPEKNAEVDGVANSMHLAVNGASNAIDMAPIPGRSIGDVVDAFKHQGITITEALEEGKGTPNHHWHLGTRPEGKQASAAAAVIASNPKDKDHFRPATPAEAQAQGAKAGQIETTTGRFYPTPESADGVSSAAKGKISAQDAIYLKGLRTDTDQSDKMAQLLTEFVGLNKKVDTGGIMATPGAAVVLSKFNSDAGRMQSIVSNITPAMRNGLPGAASDKDVAMFRQATVGLDKPRGTNEAILKAAKVWAIRQKDYVAFMESYTLRNGTILGAREVWDAYAKSFPMFSEGKDGAIQVNQIPPWRSVIPINAGSADSPVAPTHRVWTPDGGVK